MHPLRAKLKKTTVTKCFNFMFLLFKNTTEFLDSKKEVKMVGPERFELSIRTPWRGGLVF